MAVLAKQAVAPLQANEVGIIRRKLASFDVSSIIVHVCTTETLCRLQVYKCLETLHCFCTSYESWKFTVRVLHVHKVAKLPIFSSLQNGLP